MPRAICLAQETSLIGCTISSSFKMVCNGPYGQNSIIMQNTGA